MNAYKITKLFPSFFLMFSLLLLTSCSMMTPLTKAASDGNVSQIKTLIQQGANVNEPNKGKYYATPLHWAARHGHVEASKVLLDSGANLNENDYCNQTPLVYAIYGNTEGGTEIAKILIEGGANTETIDCFGWKAINYAKQNNNAPIISLIETKSRLVDKRTGMDDPDFMPDKFSINFKNAIPKLNHTGSLSVSVEVIDKRPYVISGKTKTDYVGYVRPYAWRPTESMTTSDKRPLSEVLTMCVSESLKSAGYTVIEKSAKANRSLIMLLNEWISDAGYNVGFKYDIALNVMSEKGVLIATGTVRGLDDLGSAQGMLLIQSKLLVPEAAQKHLTELLNKPEIAAALR